MTKKDFELIAAALANARSLLAIRTSATAIAGQGVDFSALSLANALATTNPRFDRARFLAACKVAS